MDHQAEFTQLVTEYLGHEAAESIDWTAPRLLCIAGDFTRYDAHAVEQISRNIDLIRYQRFGDELLLFELVHASSAHVVPSEAAGGPKPQPQVLKGLKVPLLDLYGELRDHLLALGDDVQVKELKYYVAFKRLKNFACVNVHPAKGSITVWVKIDPAHISLEPGFTRDVSKIGHYGVGDLEVTLSSSGDIERAKTLLQASYEAN